MSLPIPLAVREQAAEWLVELQSDDHSAGTREMLVQRLQHWRESHPDHERAWLRIEAMGARLQPLSGTPASVALAQAARTADHPFNAGLMAEALAAEARRVLMSGQTARQRRA